MFRALLACLLLSACSQSVTHKYISIVVLKTTCGEFDAAILFRPDGTVKEEYDIALANKAAIDIPISHGKTVIDGPCRHNKL